MAGLFLFSLTGFLILKRWQRKVVAGSLSTNDIYNHLDGLTVHYGYCFPEAPLLVVQVRKDKVHPEGHAEWTLDDQSPSSFRISVKSHQVGTTLVWRATGRRNATYPGVVSGIEKISLSSAVLGAVGFLADLLGIIDFIFGD